MKRDRWIPELERILDSWDQWIQEIQGNSETHEITETPEIRDHKKREDTQNMSLIQADLKVDQSIPELKADLQPMKIDPWMLEWIRDSTPDILIGLPLLKDTHIQITSKGDQSILEDWSQERILDSNTESLTDHMIPGWWETHSKEDQ